MAALKKTLDKLSRRSTDPRDKARRFKRNVDVLCRYYEHGTCKRGDACNFAHQDSDGSADSDWVPPNGTDSWADMDTSASEVESEADASSVSSHSSGWSAGSSWNNKRGRRRKPKKKKAKPKDGDQSEGSDNGGKDVKRKRAKRKRKAGKSGGSKGSGKPGTKNGPNNKSSRKNVCFSWRDTGVCETAGCRFVHA